MKIGILETGLLNEKLAGKFDPYPLMFAALLNRSGTDFDFQSYSVIRGEMPNSIDDCDGWLITGSRHGVYERLDWMQNLEIFIREIAASQIPLVGICFGHQIIAQALDGEVTKSDKGWGVGLHQYTLQKPPAWMKNTSETIGIYAFHQDQVIAAPEAAEVFLRSDFCPIAGLVYGDSILSVQGHPEFEPRYEQALLDIYGGNIVAEKETEAARASMQDDVADTVILANWIADFFLLERSALVNQASS